MKLTLRTGTIITLEGSACSSSHLPPYKNHKEESFSLVLLQRDRQTDTLTKSEEKMKIFYVSCNRTGISEK